MNSAEITKILVKFFGTNGYLQKANHIHNEFTIYNHEDGDTELILSFEPDTLEVNVILKKIKKKLLGITAMTIHSVKLDSHIEYGEEESNPILKVYLKKGINIVLQTQPSNSVWVFDQEPPNQPLKRDALKGAA